MHIKLPINSRIGAGDLLKRATTAIGIKPCGGCSERAAALNRLATFVPSEWGRPPDVPDGWTREAGYEANGKRLELFHDGTGKLMIWQITDGQYSNSHTFCCGPGMRKAAAERWEQLCRLL